MTIEIKETDEGFCLSYIDPLFTVSYFWDVTKQKVRQSQEVIGVKITTLGKAKAIAGHDLKMKIKAIHKTLREMGY